MENFAVYTDRVVREIGSRLPDDTRVEIREIPRTNQGISRALVIVGGSRNVSPAIYLEDFYCQYREGKSFRDTLEEILGYYRKHDSGTWLDTSFLQDPQTVKKRIVCRLINRNKNMSMLRGVPHKRFLDLAVVYFCLIDSFEYGSAGILVKNEHLHPWQIDRENLDVIAMENTHALLPCEFLSMHDMMEQVFGQSLSRGIEEEIPLYVLSNRSKCYGAVWITEPGVLESIREKLGEDFFVLPSSVHECMIVPVSMQSDERTLRQMVTEINATQVEPDEVLADSVYRYMSSTGELTLVSAD